MSSRPTNVKVYDIHVHNGGIHKESKHSVPPVVALCLANVQSP